MTQGHQGFVITSYAWWNRFTKNFAIGDRDSDGQVVTMVAFLSRSSARKLFVLLYLFDSRYTAEIVDVVGRDNSS
jgi:hypothetical protein